MITKAFAVYDSKAKFFGVPFFMQQTGLAVRAFTDLVNDANSIVHKYPGDFSLYEIGTFDDSVGKMYSSEVHELLGHGSDFKPTLEGRELVGSTMEKFVPHQEG